MNHKKQPILYPIGWIFGSIAFIRRWLYRKHLLPTYHPGIPVICVGNIAVGGTGKTPHAGHIVKLLSSQYNVAMLSRGYGRKSKGYLLANDFQEEQLSAELIGDEPLLLHERFPHLPLAVDGNRKEGIIRLQQYAPETDVIIMDDAYQHLSVSPTLKLILTEYSRPYFEDYPMPAGRLREFPSAVQEADAVLVTKVGQSISEEERSIWRTKLQLRKDQPLFFTHYAYSAPEPVTPSAQKHPISESTPIILMTGIAHSEPLAEHLRKSYNIIKHLKFPDHHRYTLFEIEKIKQACFSTDAPPVLFTTEKDWMRLQSNHIKKSLSLLPVFILPIEVEFSSEQESQNFTNIIISHVGRKTQKN